MNFIRRIDVRLRFAAVFLLAGGAYAGSLFLKTTPLTQIFIAKQIIGVLPHIMIGVAAPFIVLLLMVLLFKSLRVKYFYLVLLLYCAVYFSCCVVYDQAFGIFDAIAVMCAMFLNMWLFELTWVEPNLQRLENEQLREPEESIN